MSLDGVVSRVYGSVIPLVNKFPFTCIVPLEKRAGSFAFGFTKVFIVKVPSFDFSPPVATICMEPTGTASPSSVNLLSSPL